MKEATSQENGDGDCDGDAHSTASGDGVQIGPDLNESRYPLDKKLYRQILLPNGLRAVLISDTVAMQSGDGDVEYYSDEEDEDEDKSMEEEGKSDDDDDSDSEGEEDEDEDNGPRKAAAALTVYTGSFYDPPQTPGLAHFLEHMLFMGTTKYPVENAYDTFLTKNGGSDNAYTEDEHTMYHLEIPQDKFFAALDMMAQFFVQPLMLKDAVERELNAIESEFQLSRNSDECRQQMLVCHQCQLEQEQGRKERQQTNSNDNHNDNNSNDEKKEEECNITHPFANFGWGNLNSLQTQPKENGVDIMKEVWKFYNAHYYAQNMGLVVIGAFTLDQLQEQVIKCFSDIPDSPRTTTATTSSTNNDTHENDPFYQALRMKRTNAKTWDTQTTSPIEKFGMPFQPSPTSILGHKLCRMVPVKDTHTLTISWQMPPQSQNWKSKPCDTLAHLLGHEASGSLLSAMKERMWANSCYAGVGSGGYENASSHAFFTMNFTLLEEGVEHWSEIVEYVYTYIGMIRYYCDLEEGLPLWIYEELRAIQEFSYKYQDDMDPVDLVEDIAFNLAPYKCLPPERLLDGTELLFEYDGDVIKDLVNNYMKPSNARVDLISSTFGRAADYEDKDVTVPSSSSSSTTENTNQSPSCASDNFSPSSAGEPDVEPIFGTRSWLQTISSDVIEKWSIASEPKLPLDASGIQLPPVNPFIPENFELKPTPSDDTHHPLLFCSLMITVTVKKKKLRFPCTVTKYDGNKNQVLLTYEDEDEKWHKVDVPFADMKSMTVLPSDEGTFDNKATKYKIIAVPKDGEGAIFKFGDDTDWDVEDGIHFPPIPPKMPESRMPQLVHNTKLLKIWHCQDRKFKRPIAELRLNVVCAEANKTPMHKACADLLAHLVHDAITEISYLASVCYLEHSVSATDVGFTIRIYGMDDKLLDLARRVLVTFFSFNLTGESLPEGINPNRFDVCLEVLNRKYGNCGMKASSLCSDVRLRCIRSTIWSPKSKADAVKNLSISDFMKITSSLLSKISIEALYHGNVEKSDAVAAKDIISSVTSNCKGIQKRSHFPSQHVMVLAPSKQFGAIVPTLDRKEPNTAIEVYFQIGKDNLVDRVLIDLLVQIMEEPFFNQLRTKEQYGYSVSCGSRWTYGIMGICFKVVTTCKSATDVDDRIESFLTSYREDLVSLKDETFMENVVGLAKNKLEQFNSLEDECGHLWGEILERRYDWDIHRKEAQTLRSITKEQVLNGYDKWLNPKEKKRRRLVVHTIGTTEGVASVGRPCDAVTSLEDLVDNSIKAFHKDAGNKNWGNITFD